MARRSSKRRSRRNPKHMVANRRRSRRMRRNRVEDLMKNLLGGADVVKDVLVPVLGATGGFVTARYLGNMMAQKDLISSDPRVTKSIAAGVGIPFTFLAATGVPMVAKNSGAIVVGMGLAAAESWLRDTALLGGAPVAAALTEDAPILPAASNGSSEPGESSSENGDGLASYYNYATNRMGQAASLASYYNYATNRMGQAASLASYYNYPTNREGQAVSGLDDYYTAGMLGNDDPSDQAQVENALDSMEDTNGNAVDAVSTVIPTDTAMQAPNMPQFASVTESFAWGDRAYAGGMFARHLFSGMAGS
jgi:hypothetical protein